jgi:hypothetical protein
MTLLGVDTRVREVSHTGTGGVRARVKASFLGVVVCLGYYNTYTPFHRAHRPPSLAHQHTGACTHAARGHAPGQPACKVSRRGSGAAFCWPLSGLCRSLGRGTRYARWCPAPRWGRHLEDGLGRCVWRARGVGGLQGQPLLRSQASLLLPPPPRPPPRRQLATGCLPPRPPWRRARLGRRGSLWDGARGLRTAVLCRTYGAKMCHACSVRPPPEGRSQVPLAPRVSSALCAPTPGEVGGTTAEAEGRRSMLRHTLRSLARAAAPATHTPVAAAAACAVWGQQVRCCLESARRRPPLAAGRTGQCVGLLSSLFCTVWKAVRLRPATAATRRVARLDARDTAGVFEERWWRGGEEP